MFSFQVEEPSNIMTTIISIHRNSFQPNNLQKPALYKHREKYVMYFQAGIGGAYVLWKKIWKQIKSEALKNVKDILRLSKFNTTHMFFIVFAF